MQLTPHVPRFSSRREFLFKAGGGFGALALAYLLQRDQARADNPRPHFAARATSVIFLFMEGGPSHLDTFDPKPELTRRHGQRLPARFGNVVTPMGTGGNALLASRRTFRRAGRSGLPISDWLPHLSTCADDLCVLRSCHADGLNHVGSVCQMNTGSILAGRPSLGSWVTYGLGSENQNLPAFVVMTDNPGEVAGGARNWGTGFMPATYQGTHFRPAGAPILHLSPPSAVGPEQQRQRLDLINQLNRHHAAGRPGDTELAARMNAYELAYRMQAAAPEVVDLSQESVRTREEYGLNRRETADFGHRCLLARRLVERGVRFVQVYCGAGSQWDAHSNLEDNHTRLCTRRPADGGAAARPEAARLAGNDAGDLGRRVRPHADDGGHQRPRPQPLRLHDGAGRWGSPRRPHSRHHRRVRPARRREPHACA